MKRIKSFALSIIISIILTACSSERPPSPMNNKEWENIELPVNEIILVSQYINFASGYEHRGIFIDSNGGVYSFDFSQEIYNYNEDETDEEFINKLQVIRTYAEPFVILDTDIQKELYWYISQMNKEAPFAKEHEAHDAGENQLIVCDTSTHELVLCRETGDYSGTLLNTYAQKLCSLYDDTIQEIIRNGTVEAETIHPETNRREIIYTDKYLTNKTHYYTETDLNIENIHCGYSEHEGRYVITTPEQLDAFTRTTGIDISEYDWAGVFPSDYYAYFIEIVNVSNTGYDLIKSGIMCKGGAFEFISSPDSKTPEPDMQYGEAMDG